MAWFRYDETDIPGRYDESRRFPAQTLRMWLEAFSDCIPSGSVHTIIDVGCGTGRFTQPLADHFEAEVIGVDPSEKMLREAVRPTSSPRVYFVRATADSLPIKNRSADLVFMSQVYHHLGDKPRAAQEFGRVLKQGGHLCVRTSTKEIMDSCLYAKFFPEAKAIALSRLPSRDEVKQPFLRHGFELGAERVVRQLWAQDLSEYYEKLSLRATSDLASIPDEEFRQGLRALKEYCQEHDRGEPVFENIDLFVFRAVSC